MQCYVLVLKDLFPQLLRGLLADCPQLSVSLGMSLSEKEWSHGRACAFPGQPLFKDWGHRAGHCANSGQFQRAIPASEITKRSAEVVQPNLSLCLLPPSSLPPCTSAKSLSRVRLFVTPWTVAHQAPLSIEFSRQEYWSGYSPMEDNQKSTP